MKTKICSKCGIEKSIKEFYKNKTHKGGFSSWCKDCRKNYRDSHKKEIAEQRITYKEQAKEYRKIYYRLHKKEAKEYYQLHKEEELARGKKYRYFHKEEMREHKKEYYIFHKEEIKRQHKEYHQSHKKETAKRVKQRRQTDINFKILGNLRSRVFHALKGNIKSKPTNLLIGCSVDFLKQYLASQFLPGMTWKNHGNGWLGKKEWHIDHIKPCVLFDLSKPSEQYKCFNYTNLQPLWAIDNLIKSDKFN